MIISSSLFTVNFRSSLCTYTKGVSIVISSRNGSQFRSHPNRKLQFKIPEINLGIFSKTVLSGQHSWIAKVSVGGRWLFKAGFISYTELICVSDVLTAMPQNEGDRRQQ